MNGLKQSKRRPASTAPSTLSEKPVPAIPGATTSPVDSAHHSNAAAARSPSTSTGSNVPHSRVDTRQLADYVLVFQAISKKHLRSHTKVPATERAQIAREYEALVEAIRATDLHVTSRQGAPNTGQILLFVKADERRLASLARDEALVDYLHGVLSVEPPPQRSSSLAGGHAASTPLAITPASRVRFVHSLLTLPPAAPNPTAAPSTDKAKAPSGAGLRVLSQPFPHLIDMSPIHDPEYNTAWVQRWSHTAPTAILSGIGTEDLDSVREHFGEDVGVYFGFLNFYFQALAPLALWGAGFWAFGSPYSPLYSFGLVTWACLTVELWRMKERKLAVRWGTLGVDRVDRRRDTFSPRTKRTDPATGQEEEVFEWWRRELRVVLSLPVMLLFASLLAATMTLMFVVEIFVVHLYHGAGKQAVPFVPTVLLTVAVPQIMAAWQATAASLTSWENHYSTKSHDYSLTLKRFALQGMVAYGALFLSAFVYIPFGEAIMEEMVQRGFFRDSIRTAIREGKIPPQGIDFKINPDRLHTQLFAVSVTSQAVGAFTELMLPLLMRKVQEWKQQRDANRASRGGAGSGGKEADSTDDGSKQESGDNDEEARFVKRVQKELELPPYDLFGDYAEMATQFGYITLWSVIWPLSPVMGFVNNFFELRADAAKICLNQRRPVPVRAQSVGPWLEVLGFLAWLSALSNSALVYLFQQSAEAGHAGHSKYETTLRSHLHPSLRGAAPPTNASDAQSSLSFSRLLPAYIPTSGASGAIVAAVLVALTSEHAYGLVRAGVRHVLERWVWRGSAEEEVVRRRTWRARVESLKAKVGEDEGEAERQAWQDVLEGEFWRKERDVGSSIVRASGKVE